MFAYCLGNNHKYSRPFATRDEARKQALATLPADTLVVVGKVQYVPLIHLVDMPALIADFHDSVSYSLEYSQEPEAVDDLYRVVGLLQDWASSVEVRQIVDLETVSRPVKAAPAAALQALLKIFRS